MAVLQRLAEQRASVVGPLQPRDPALADWFGGGATASGESVTPTTAMQERTVMACERYLSETIAALPLDLNERLQPHGRRPAVDHWLHDRLHTRPNVYQTSYQWRRLLMNWYLMRGNFYVLIQPSVRRPPFELLPLHPDRMRHIEGEDGLRSYVYNSQKRGPLPLRFGEVFHIGHMPGDGWKGRSVIEFARDTIGLGLVLEKFSGRIFRNQARPGLALKSKRKLSTEARQKLKEQIQDKFTGPNAYGVMVLEEDLDFETVQMTNQDAQTLQLWEMTGIGITQIFNVPPHKVKFMGRATWNNIESQNIDAVTDSLVPICFAWEQGISRDLLTDTESKRFYAKFNVDGLLRGDFKTRQEGLAIQRQNGVLSANDWLEYEDRNPIDDPSGNMYFMPLNMAPMEQPVLETGTGESLLAEDAVASEIQQLALNGAQIASLLTVIQQVTAKQLPPTTATEILKVAFPTLSQVQIDRLIGSAEEFEPALQGVANRTLLAPREARFIEQLLRHQRAYEPVIEDSSRRVLRREVDALTRGFKKMLQERSLPEFGNWLKTWYEEHKRTIILTLSPALRSYIETVSLTAAEMVNAKPVNLESFSHSYMTSTAQRHVSESLAELRRILEATPPEELPDAFEARMAAWLDGRPASDARNEAARAASAVSRFIWAEAGVHELRWVTGTSCATCSPLDGAVVGIREQFEGGVSHAPLHDSCSCQVVPA